MTPPIADSAKPNQGWVSSPRVYWLRLTCRYALGGKPSLVGSLPRRTTYEAGIVILDGVPLEFLGIPQTNSPRPDERWIDARCFKLTGYNAISPVVEADLGVKKNSGRAFAICQPRWEA